MNPVRLGSDQAYSSKVVCIGRNYLDHITELGNKVPREPVIFLKPNSSISVYLFCDDNDGIHYEGELSFLIRAGRPHAVGFGLDLTKRNVQAELKAKGLPWERAKAFDGAAVFSHFVKIEGDVAKLNLELQINGRMEQKGGVELMLHKPLDLIEHIQRFISLEDNDIVMTGTPKGVGAVRPGDRFTGRVLDGQSLLLEASWTARLASES
ncbi:MAG: 2-keto-4-pentenoate hydratase [Lysobacteraceae bacterium]|nr:MAG: 2-keto-4-pentenoate hydratase [Xanthomonadaceae bacterium]